MSVDRPPPRSVDSAGPGALGPANDKADQLTREVMDYGVVIVGGGPAGVCKGGEDEGGLRDDEAGTPCHFRPSWDTGRRRSDGVVPGCRAVQYPDTAQCKSGIRPAASRPSGP